MKRRRGERKGASETTAKNDGSGEVATAEIRHKTGVEIQGGTRAPSTHAKKDEGERNARDDSNETPPAERKSRDAPPTTDDAHAKIAAALDEEAVKEDVVEEGNPPETEEGTAGENVGQGDGLFCIPRLSAFTPTGVKRTAFKTSVRLRVQMGSAVEGCFGLSP